LTATPSTYIERNTFKFYQCKDGQPDFVYPIQQAFEEGYLIPYKFATGITVILAQGAEKDEEIYDPAEFERKWTNEDTNRKMMEEFDRLARENYKELAPGQKIGPGKAIIFAITKHHAARLAYFLNELHLELKGQYAQVITSDVANADDLIRKFKREDYPQVAVSVGMLDTGFDCREVLHLVMCRRVRSPILYQQMRGRGTRTAPHIDKQKFVIYDFFENHKYFNDSDTDILTGTGTGRAPGRVHRPPRPPGNLIELGLEDEWLHSVTYVQDLSACLVQADKESKHKEKVWFYEIRADGFDPDKIQGGGRPETPERNDIPDLLAKWNEYKASGYKNPPGVQAGTLLDPGSEEPRSWWATIKAIAEPFSGTKKLKRKGDVAEKAPDEDPG